MNKKGNVFVVSTFFIAGVLVILLFTVLIFVSEINSLLYNIKLDMYSINKSAVISVNKGITSREKFSYDKDTYKEYFIKMLKANYKLDDELKNNNGVIQSVKVLEYDIRSTQKDTTIYSVIEVKVKPIIFSNMLKDLFTFEIHESTALNILEI